MIGIIFKSKLKGKCKYVVVDQILFDWINEMMVYISGFAKLHAVVDHDLFCLHV